ncbi:MAG: short chain dehydrogenase [Gammaproteobacteria bacterium]|nr:MAG: short chain dehydrogenase [Pseudomonadota bacterium]PIE37995.1 MAG: short chain dehydrogenase [Gammaproteobacteria bacterium]
MVSKRVFITGGASGLGKETALVFSRHGHKVCIGDVNDERGSEAEQELLAIKPGSMYRHCDVSKSRDLETIRDELVKEWGGVDIVINNAGVAGVAGYIEDSTLTDWDWVLNINLMGVVRGCKAFIPVLKEQGGGHIVNIASMAGLMSAPMMANYNVSKAGVVSLSETLRVELDPFHIGTSVVCPAFFETNLCESLRSNVDGVEGRVQKMMARSGISANDVAKAIYRAVRKNEFYVLTHKDEKRLWQLKRLWPDGFAYLLKRKTKGLMPGLKKK